VKFSGVSPGALAKACSRSTDAHRGLSNEETGVTADTAFAPVEGFRHFTRLWLNLQTDYDVQDCEQQIGKDLAKIERSGRRHIPLV